MRSASKSSAGTRKSVAFIGAGALATSMAHSLSKRGYRISEFIVRTKVRPSAQLKALAQGLNARISTMNNSVLDADIIWLAVSDDAIEDCAVNLAKGRNLRGKIALHSSGALSSEALAPLRNAGASVASLHPMMSFSLGNRNPELKGVWFSAEGQSAAIRLARQIVNAVEGKILTLKPDQKALYHAFGAMIAPLLVSHLEAAEQMGRRVGLPPKNAREVMKPIVNRVISAFLSAGAQQAYSGPFLRGDVRTVERHLGALRGTDEDAVYRALAEYAIDHIKGENREELRKVLSKR